jgi:hypothetical protein
VDLFTWLSVLKRLFPRVTVVVLVLGCVFFRGLTIELFTDAAAQRAREVTATLESVLKPMLANLEKPPAIPERTLEPGSPGGLRTAAK